jgi:hypothetical protein
MERRCAIAAAVLGLACGSPGTGGDPDSGGILPRADSGPADARVAMPDTGADAGAIGSDAGPPGPDGGMPDGGPPPPPGTTVLAVGDIAECTVLGLLGLATDPHELTADLVDTFPGTTPIFALGDLVYSDGTELEFSTCYARRWGAFRDRTHPVPGNHDYNTSGAGPYYDYFGDRVAPGLGYYSFELGGWHVVGLNSNCGEIGGCGAGSPQMAWLLADLAASTARCTVAMWHHPRWTSDRSLDNAGYQPFMDALYDAGADLVLVGHAHNYERFGAAMPDGTPDAVTGIRQFVVGTGGADLRGLATPSSGPSEVFYDDSFGILELTLRENGYDWRFVPTDGSFSDVGSELCH